MDKHQPTSILIIRDFPEQLTCGDCCGRLGNEPMVRESFRQTGITTIEIGRLHRWLRSEYGARCRIEQVDPRNQLSLFWLLVRQVFKHRPRLFSGLRTILMLFSVPAMIVDGRVIVTNKDINFVTAKAKLQLIKSMK